MITKNGIELNIKESKFNFVINETKFYFSSELYMNKFKNEYKTFIDMETIKLKNKYKFNIRADLMLLLEFYKRIEKRGFYIKNLSNNQEITENTSFNLIINE